MRIDIDITPITRWAINTVIMMLIAAAAILIIQSVSINDLPL